MGDIALSNTINVSLSATPQGLGEFNTNTICLLSNEQPLSSKGYIWAVSADEIEDEYGSDSLTAKMAQGLFNPIPNLRTGRGQVLVYNFDGVSATSASVTTEEIGTDKIQAFKSVSDGVLTLNIDGVNNQLTGLNFSSINTANDVVTVLKAGNLDCDITLTSDNKIQFTSRRVGLTDSLISLAETAEGGTDIYGATYLNGADAVSVAGTNASGTTLADAVADAYEIGYFGGVITTQKCENELVVQNASTLANKDCVYFESTASLENIGVLGASIDSAGLTETKLFAYSMGNDKVALATYASMAQSTNFNGSDTAITMNLKELAGIAPDTNLNQTYWNMARTNGVDIYGSVAGVSVVYSFSNGNYVDDAVNALWLKKALEVAGFNYLRQTNTKIPQTEAGMAGLKNAYSHVCEQGVRNGVIGAGLEWNNSIPFGDPETFKENIRKNGFYVYSLPIAQQNQAEREQRIAPVVQIAVKFAGAIHSSDVIVTIQK